MQLLLALFAIGIIQIAVADIKSMLEEDLAISRGKAEPNLKDSRASDDEWAKKSQSCRPIPARKLRAILARRIKVLRTLGVRVVQVSGRMQRALRKTRKVVQVHRRPGNSDILCQESNTMILVPANVEATVAYMLTSVTCTNGNCVSGISRNSHLRLLIGRCVLRTVRIVLPIFHNCRPYTYKTFEVGCACQCVRNRY